MSSSSNVQTFNRSAGNRPTRRNKAPPPFSIRFTDDERARLERAAGTLSLAAYIRLKLFEGQDLPPGRRRITKKVRQPSAELAVLGQMLSALGQSRLANNLNQIARAANTGTLDLDGDTEAELQRACADIAAMRHDLIRALGLSPE